MADGGGEEAEEGRPYFDHSDLGQNVVEKDFDEIGGFIDILFLEVDDFPVNVAADGRQKAISVHIHRCPLLLAHELFHVFETALQLLSRGFITHGLFELAVDLRHTERVEQHEGEVVEILLQQSVGVVGDLQNGQFGRRAHHCVLAVVDFEQLQEQREVRFAVIDEDCDKFVILVDFPDHELQEVGEVCLILLLPEEFALPDEALLADLQQEVDQLLFFFERLQQKLQQAERTPQQLPRRGVFFHFAVQQL